MSIPEHLYSTALLGARALLPLLARGEGKLARGVRGRRGVLARLERWAAEGRDPSRPLVWFHAPSVGEGLQARVTLQALRARRPELQIAYTYFSPSAERFAESVPADWRDYLPLDTASAMGRMIELLRPEVIAFSKTDVWPVLTREAQRRGVRLAMLSATLPPNSSRLGGPARWLLGAAYRRLDHVAAISAADAERFAALDVPAARRSVMGDARFDQVARRAAAVDLGSALLAPLRDAGRRTLVAGSTWPADEDRLLGALHSLDARRRDWRLILVPHEPTPGHLARLESVLDRHAISHRRLSAAAHEAPEEVLVVDRVGVLGELYALADLAYVGGGWGTAGLHSVLEPAAFGVPVVFGPNHENAREAAELVRLGAAFSPPEPAALRDSLDALLTDPARRDRAGRAARVYVEANLGAADRGAAVVEHLLAR
jgi:3-deoxy-D-manno-octulosonic-acid transferase